MEVYELRSFVVLAEHLHFGRAAAALNLSQPALTKQVRKMEAELGCPLFERGTHGTNLTSFGRQWLPQAKALVSQFDRTLEQGKKAAKGETGRLGIGFGFHTLDLVTRVVVKLRAEAPGIEVTLRDMSTKEQMPALETGLLDLGFARQPLPGNLELESMPAIQDRLSLVLPEDPPLAADFTLADCRDQPFVVISPDRSPGMHRQTLGIFAQYGYHPRIVQEVTEFSTSLALVRAGMGLTILPESFWSDTFPGLQRYWIPDEATVWNVAAVWRKRDANPALERFLRLLRVELGLESA